MLETLSSNLFLIATICGSIGVIFASFLAFHKKVVRPTQRILEALLDLAEAQLTPNGGSSLIDKVDAQMDMQTSLVRNLNEHTASDRDNFKQQILVSQDILEKVQEHLNSHSEVK